MDLVLVGVVMAVALNAVTLFAAVGGIFWWGGKITTLLSDYKEDLDEVKRSTSHNRNDIIKNANNITKIDARCVETHSRS